MDRSEARKNILKTSPTLQHTESWIETLSSGQEYLPPPPFYLVVIVAVAFAYLDAQLKAADPQHGKGYWWELPDEAHNTLLVLLSLLLAFRTSEAYSRWWEARTLWGQIVNSTRSISSNTATWFDNLDRQRQIIKLTICFAWTTKAALRGVRPSEEELGGLLDGYLLDIAVGEYDEVTNDSDYPQGYVPHTAHLPMMIVDEIRHAIRCEVDEQAENSMGRPLNASWDMVMGRDISALVNALGGCERIQKTPMPFGYLAQQRIFMLSWLLTYPVCIIGDYGWWTVPMMTFISFIMLKVDAIGVEIEHPFGPHKHDLPLESICIGIEKNLLEILRRAESRYLKIYSHHDTASQVLTGKQENIEML